MGRGRRSALDVLPTRAMPMLVGSILLVLAGVVATPPTVTTADHCGREMPGLFSMAVGNLFVARYLGPRQVDGGGRREQVFAVGRVVANGGSWDERGRLRLARGRRLALTRDACAPIHDLTIGARYLVSTSHLFSLSSQNAVAWRLRSNGAIELQRQYASRNMDPRFGRPTTLRQAVRLMRPALDGVGQNGSVPPLATSQLHVPCTGEARLMPPEGEASGGDAPTPELRASWSRMRPAPFGAQDATAAWTGDRLVVVDPQTGRTAAWDAQSGRWGERRRAPFAFALDSPSVWDGRRLLLLAEHRDELIPVAYHVGSDEWLPMARAPMGPAVAAVWTGASLVAATDRGEVAAYDPETDCWRALPTIEGAGSVNRLLWTGERLFADTRTPIEAPRGTESVTILAELDSATLTWHDHPPAPARVGHSVEPVAAGGRILYWSGDPVGSDTTNQAFDLASSSWQGLDWTCPSVGSDPMLIGRVLVSSNGRGTLDPASGECRAMPAPPRPQVAGRPILGRAPVVATGGALIAWSGTKTEDGPPVRDGAILRLGPR